MGKCNLIAPITNDTGNFVLFSQYSEDLTKSMHSEDFYRVVPSKYVVIKLGQKTGWDAAKYAEFFQNYYENSCAIMRSTSSVDWKPEYALHTLVKALVKSEMISEPTNSGEDEDESLVSSSILYCGDINITSTKQFDGINYSETYISIPQDSKVHKYAFGMFGSGMSKSVLWPNDYIMGYPDEEYPTDGTQNWPSNHLTSEYADDVVDGEFLYEIMSSDDYDFTLEDVGTLDNEKYTFDAILVLYDIYNRDTDSSEEYIVHRNIPMGIYFTGSPDVDGSIKNPVTVYTTNEDIYQQGTSYGFRICTRYLSTQNQIYIVDSTIEDTKEMYDQYATVMSKICESQAKMDQVIKDMSKYQERVTSTLSNIKNYNVNVPYIVNVGGVGYWFVNGKNLGYSTSETSLVWENY